MWYMIRNLRCTVTIDSVLTNSKTQNAFLFTVNAIFLHDYPLVVEPGSTPRPLIQKKTWRDSLPLDMLLSAVSVLVVAQSSSEIPEGLMNNPVNNVRLQMAEAVESMCYHVTPEILCSITKKLQKLCALIRARYFSLSSLYDKPTEGELYSGHLLHS